jgi:hypothetical protein
MSTTNTVNHSSDNIIITPAPPKKKAKKVVEVTDVDDNINKAPNFHSDEDQLLCIAWVSATDNSLVGCGQKAIVFWNDVHTRYTKLQEKSVSIETKYPRTWNQLKGRFLRHIQVNVNIFNKYYKKAAENIPSGHSCTTDAIMERAMEEYQLENKKPFRFAACIPVLHIIPKFDPMVVTVNDDNQPEQPSIMGCSLQRPMGNKAAKLMKKNDDKNSTNLSEIKGQFQKMLESTVRKEAFEELVVLGKYYKSIGNVEKMLATTAHLESLVEKNVKAREEDLITIIHKKNAVPEVIILPDEDPVSSATSISSTTESVAPVQV